MTTPKGKARYIMIGGFLGAGKTTAVGKLAARLTKQGLRVGLITNDQGRNLVDTAMLRSQGFATEEIPGGCFCCRFNSLVEAAHRLTEQSRPQVFIAEPVGSCRRYRAMNPVAPGDVVGGRDHAPLLRRAAYDNRLADQLRPVALLDACVERIHICVDYHGPHLNSCTSRR